MYLNFLFRLMAQLDELIYLHIEGYSKKVGLATNLYIIFQSIHANSFSELISQYKQKLMLNVFTPFFGYFIINKVWFSLIPLTNKSFYI